MKYLHFICSYLLLVLLIGSSQALFATTNNAIPIRLPALVGKFYAATNQQLFWLKKTPGANALRSLLLQKLDSVAYAGLDKKKYQFSQLNLQLKKALGNNDSVGTMKLDRLLTGMALAYCKDLYQGFGIAPGLQYDGISSKQEGPDNEFLLAHLESIGSAGDLELFLRSLEPSTPEYAAYKAELGIQIAANNANKIAKLNTAMNFYRWVLHFKFDNYILVNVASATLHYYRNDTEKLFSRIIVGKPKTRTPRFLATCNEVILYPYWNVPKSIATKELLPRYKKAPSRIDAENMQMLNAAGTIVNPHTVRWSQYSRQYFPYRFRQSTGCDNSLGVIKFNLTSPFDVYLHDTNTKGLFASKNRYRSHGCIRVEQAQELGNLLLNNKLDTTYLQSCIKGEKPVELKLDRPIPVFVVYLPAGIDEAGAVGYYNDPYLLFRK